MMAAGTRREAETLAEYKQVTVLFADVVQSMAIATAVGGGTAARNHGGNGRPGFVGGAALRRHGGQIHRRRHHGVVRCADGVGRPRAAGMFGRVGYSGEVSQVLAVVVNDRDGMELRMRIGLNSGQVIAGEIGSGALGYTAIGDQVGLAQRMESVAPPGGVMLSESTARLIEGSAVLGEPEMVHIKGSADAVSARQLLRVSLAGEGPVARMRRWWDGNGNWPR